jgi:hypothetical protein
MSMIQHHLKELVGAKPPLEEGRSKGGRRRTDRPGAEGSAVGGWPGHPPATRDISIAVEALSVLPAIQSGWHVPDG